MNGKDTKNPLDFDPNDMSPQDKEVANVVFKCFLESAVISIGSGYVAFRQTGSYIVAKGSPTMKSWASVIKFGVGFGIFSFARNLYGRGVCLPRLRNLPPSPIKDRILSSFDYQQVRTEDPRISGPLSALEGLKPQELDEGKIAPRIAHPTSAHRGIKPQEPDEEQIDYKTHQTDENFKSFDEDKNTHLNRKGKDFDYSNSYSLPPAEAPSKVVRRNKYGDVVEDA